MNLNHDPDKHLLDQIDKLLETHQPAGNEVLDELASTRPTPRPAFQNALEQRLLARFNSIKQGETPMVNSTAYLPIPAPRRNWLPLTLLVALLVVAIAGVMLINGRGKSPTPNEMALAAASATPTESLAPPVISQNLRIPGVGGVAPVVIAARDIPQGTVLGSAWLETVYWADDTGSTQTYTDADLLRGLVAKQAIPRWQPILPAYVTDQLVSTIQPTDVPSPNVNVVVAFQNLPRGYTFSDRDLTNVAGYAGWPANTVPTDAIRDNGQSNITNLFGKTLQTDVSRGQPILSSMLEGDLKPTADAPASRRTDSISIAIPLASITSDSLVPGVGGSVDIVALLPFKSVNLNVSTVPATFMPDGSRIAEAMLMQDTLVLYHGQWPLSNPDDKTQTITFAVSSNESRMLAWLAEQPQVTFRLQKPLTNTFDFPSDSRIESIPFENVTADENIRPGDVVDVFTTCALVPDVIGMNNTVVTSKTDCTQTEEVKRVSKATVFIGEIVVSGPQPVMSYQSIALAVPPDTVPMFTQMNDAKMHFKLVKSTAASQPTPTPVPATPTLQAGERQRLTVPLSLIASVQGKDIHASDHVNVSVTYTQGDIAKAPAELQQLLMTPQPGLSGDIIQTVAENAVIIELGNRNLTLEVSPEEAAVINLAMTYNLKLNLIQVDATGIMPTLVPTNLPVPAGKVAFDLPRASIQPLAEGVRLKVGTHVDVIASYLSIESGDTTQTVLAPVLTLQPGQNPSHITQRIVESAVITQAGDILTLVVSPEEEQVLKWALDAQLPIKLRPVDPANAFAPHYSINLNLDSISHWASDNLEVGDTVDVVAGLVLGNGQDLKLAFKPYGEYFWNDPLSRGLITAQTYSPADTASPSGAIFLRRLVQNATVIALHFDIDPASGRVQNINITLEIQADTAATQGDTLKGYIDAGMPYLIIKLAIP